MVRVVYFLIYQHMVYLIICNLKRTFILFFASVSDSTESIASALSGANSLVIAVGFVPSNPLKMAAAAHEVE